MDFVQKVSSNVTCFGRVFLIFEGCGLSPDSATYLAWFEVGVAKGCVAGKGNGRTPDWSNLGGSFCRLLPVRLDQSR